MSASSNGSCRDSPATNEASGSAATETPARRRHASRPAPQWKTSAPKSDRRAGATRGDRLVAVAPLPLHVEDVAVERDGERIQEQRRERESEPGGESTRAYAW